MLMMLFSGLEWMDDFYYHIHFFIFYSFQFSKNEYTPAWNYFNILKKVVKMPENLTVLFVSMFSVLGGHKVKGRITTDHL